jgi:hypothetical protein
MAGANTVRAAYTAHMITMAEMQLSFLETLPAAWFPGTQEFAEGMTQLEETTGHSFTFDPLDGPFEGFAADANVWLRWYRERREAMSEAQRERLDPIFARLAATSPFLTSVEFNAMIETMAALTGLEPRWQGPPGEKRYSRWIDFANDRQMWREWLEENREHLEWDPVRHRLVVGRGLGPQP